MRRHCLASLTAAVYVLLSVLFQFAIHIVALIYISDLCELLDPCVPCRSTAADLAAGPRRLISSASSSPVSSTRPSTSSRSRSRSAPSQCACERCRARTSRSDVTSNYVGRPFREGIRENPAMFYGLLGCMGVSLNGATNFVCVGHPWLRGAMLSSTFRAGPARCDIVQAHASQAGSQWPAQARAHVLRGP